MQEWYSAEEIIQFAGVTLRHAQRILKINDCKFRNRKGNLREYHINDLPKDIREKIEMYYNLEHSKNIQPKQEQQLLDIFSTKEDDLERADARKTVLDFFNKFLADNKLPKTKGKLLFTELYNNKEILNDNLMRRLIPSISEKSIYNWEKGFKENGVSGLIDSYGHRKGQTIIDSNEEIKNFICAMIYDHPHVNCKLIMRGLRGRFSKEILPSYRTVQSWVADYKRENQSLLLNIKNPDKWKNKFMSAAGSHSENISRLNQLWEFDSTPTDILLNDGKRHNIVGVIDIYSRRVKFLVSRTSDSKSVATIIRNCLLDWGVPERVKTDNGADYASKHIKRVFESLEIEQIFCPPFTPQAKPHIERVFKTFSHDLVELLPGYIGHDIVGRKDIEARKTFAQRMFNSDKKLINLNNMSVEELQQFCDQWIENVYMFSEHGGLKNKTPFEMVAGYQKEIKTIQNERALDILLSETQGDGIRVVTKKGISIDNDNYDSHFLAGHEGKQIKVLYDESSFAEIYVFTLDNEFICKATCPERKGISREEVAVARKQRQKNLISDGKQALKKLAKEHNTKDIAQEILQNRVSETKNIVSLPKQASDYSSRFLTEAENILRPEAKTRELTNGEQATLKIIEEKNNIIELPASPRQKYLRWLEIDANLMNNERVVPEDLSFWKIYQKSIEFKTQEDLRELKIIGSR